MENQLTYIGEYDRDDYRKIFKQNETKFFTPILNYLGQETVRSYLANVAIITNIKHYYVSCVDLLYKTHTLETKGEEVKGTPLKKNILLPADANCSCAELVKNTDKKSEEANAVFYEGVMYGSVETHECDKEIDCPNCNGTGKCPNCNGKKEVTCPNCNGQKKCPTCNGNRYMKCPECEGTGTIDCDNCCGTGKVDCWICYGSGDCPECNGSGTVECFKCNGYGCGYCNGTGRVPCKTCHGSGKCYRCHGRGDFYCQECDGEGEFECETCDNNHEVVCRACNGSGKCSTCNATGVIDCPTCESSGNCTNCGGSGKVVCPRCDGLGHYQTYTSYKLKEETNLYTYSSLDDKEEWKKIIKGMVIYDSVFFKSDTGKVLINETEKIISLIEHGEKNFFEWMSSIKQNSSSQVKAVENSAKIYAIPVTEITYKIDNDEYSFLVLGTNNVIAYHSLPGIMDVFFKGIFNSNSKSMKMLDEDLKFLATCQNEDLRVLVDYLTHDKDDKKRITESLTDSESYKVCYPDNLKNMWSDVAHELQLFGGNSIVNKFRGHGVPYREILIDVCKKMKVNFNKDAKIEYIEDSLLRKCLEDSVEKMSAEELKQLVQTMNLKTADYSKEVMIASLQLAIRNGGFTSYKIAVIVANGVCHALLGRGLTLAANAALTRYLALFAGPIGWLLTVICTAIDIAGPAYRVTIPCCIQIAYMRRRSMITQEQYLLECK